MLENYKLSVEMCSTIFKRLREMFNDGEHLLTIRDKYYWILLSNKLVYDIIQHNTLLQGVPLA